MLFAWYSLISAGKALSRLVLGSCGCSAIKWVYMKVSMQTHTEWLEDESNKWAYCVMRCALSTWKHRSFIQELITHFSIIFLQQLWQIYCVLLLFFVLCCAVSLWSGISAVFGDKIPVCKVALKIFFFPVVMEFGLMHNI